MHHGTVPARLLLGCIFIVASLIALLFGRRDSGSELDVIINFALNFIVMFVFGITVRHWIAAVLPGGLFLLDTIRMLAQNGWDYPGETYFLPLVVYIALAMGLASTFGWLIRLLIIDNARGSTQE
jgi:hypothetical protein